MCGKPQIFSNVTARDSYTDRRAIDSYVTNCFVSVN